MPNELAWVRFFISGRERLRDRVSATHDWSEGNGAETVYPPERTLGNMNPHHGMACISLTYTGDVPGHKDPLEECTGFEWDEGNAKKNWDLHQVTPEEAEDVFFHEPLVVHGDVGHSQREKRYYALGQTARSRWLFVAFTIRRKLIRVISVRDMNGRGRRAYDRQDKEGS